MTMPPRPAAPVAPGRRMSAPAPVADENGETRMHRQLADAIYEQRLPPGTKLPEIELCRIFGVTRGAVRKVLSRLAAEELLDLIPNRGAFVARPSVEETRDVYELRRILEAGVLRILARRAPHRWLDALRRQVAEEREASRAGDTPRYIRLAGKFHLDLVAATGNAALEQHLKRVVSRTSLMVALYDVPGMNTCSCHEHLEILDAIEAGDHGAAARLMEEHLLGCERQLRLGEEPRRVDLAQALGAASASAPGRGGQVRDPPGLGAGGG
jgi:DNA-binding GntR family transcriptional regulator